MLSRTTIRSVWMAGAFAMLIGTGAAAQGVLPDQNTYFTFSAPVTLPGVTLPAGKYEFRLANSLANRHIVQIFNSDRKIVTTLFAIPSIRMDVPNDAEIRFMETPSDMPPAIQTWWYPGTRTGHEFIYPKEQARRIAKAMKTGGVLAGEGQNGDLSRINAAGQEAKVSGETEPQPQAVTGRAQSGQNAPAEAPVVTDRKPDDTLARAEAPRTKLPKSASTLPLTSLMGVLSLTFGTALVAMRRRRATA